MIIINSKKEIHRKFSWQELLLKELQDEEDRMIFRILKDVKISETASSNKKQ